MIGPGNAVVVYLREPRERIWGVLRALDLTGVTVEGFDVDSCDAWLRSLGEGVDARSQMSVLFFPMTRVERVLLDRGSPGAPSFAERVESRFGRRVGDLIPPEAVA